MFVNENAWISIKISLIFVPNGPIHNIPAMVQIIAWRRPGDRPLSEPMMVSSLTHICVTRPQWVYNYTFKIEATHPGDNELNWWTNEIWRDLSFRWVLIEFPKSNCLNFLLFYYVYTRGVTIRLATIRYISRYTTHDMVHDTIQNQLIYYQWKILKHCGMCHQYCYIKTVILARNSEFKINKDVHNHPCPKYLLLTNCVCKQNNKIS